MSEVRKGMDRGKRYCCFVPDLINHPIVGAKKPFDPCVAWQWLVFEASWKARTYRAGSVIVPLQRGQLAHSTRFIAEAWGWPETSVRRFLKSLKSGAGTGAMIGAETGAGVTVITICNYERYQLGSETDGAANGARDGAGTGAKAAQERRRLVNRINGIEEDARPDGRTLDDPKADLYRRGEEILGKGCGGLVGQLLKAKAGSVPMARSVLEASAEKGVPRDYIGGVIRGEQKRAVDAGGYAYDPAL